MDDYEQRLRDVALKGLDAVDDFLDSAAKANTDLFRKRHLKAKVGSSAVSNQVRYMAAQNMREALEIQRERMALAPPEDSKALKAG